MPLRVLSSSLSFCLWQLRTPVRLSSRDGVANESSPIFTPHSSKHLKKAPLRERSGRHFIVTYLYSMSVMPLGGGAVGVLGPAPGTLGWDFKLFEKITASQQTSSSSSLATNHAADYGGLAATNRRMRRSGSFEESYAALSEDTLQEDDNDDNDDNDGAPALLSDDQLKEVFLLASKGTGELDVVGLHRVVEQLGFELTHAQAQELFSQWDEDGSGLIEEDEYLGLMRQVLEQEMKMWRNDKRVKPLTSATTLVHLRRREMLEALARRATATEKTLARNTRGRRAGPLPTHAERSTSSIGSGRHLSATPSRVDLSSAGSSRNVFCHAFVGRHRNWCPPRRQPKT